MFCASRERGMTNSYVGRSFAARQKRRRLIEKYDCSPGLVITRNEQQFRLKLWVCLYHARERWR